MTPLRFFLSLILATLFGQVSFAQVGRDSGLWEWTPLAAHHQAIVEISSGEGSGTGVLISVNKDKPVKDGFEGYCFCLLYTSPSPRDATLSRMPSSA